eukprot:2989155-Prymnesium_polylepis.1
MSTIRLTRPMGGPSGERATDGDAYVLTGGAAGGVPAAGGRGWAALAEVETPRRKTAVNCERRRCRRA